MAESTIESRAEEVRGFNRFYTRHLGVLDEHLLDSGFSLTEARLLFELAHRPGIAGTDLVRTLGLDAGYLSRVLASLGRRGLVVKGRSTTDGRVSALELSDAGREAFAGLDAASRREAVGLLQKLSEAAQTELTDAMERIEAVLNGSPADINLREPRPGDLGWVVHRQALLYATEYGWNAEFEALAAEIAAAFLRRFDPRCERGWIAEQGGRALGSVFVVREDETTARLRLLYVEKAARGLGLGARLVDDCVRFARSAGYERMVLGTESVLVDACRLYARCGFRLVDETPHASFGQSLVAQTWARDLV